MKPDLDAIRARCEAATPGPWELHDSGDSWRVYAQDEIVFDDGSAAGEYCTKCNEQDRDFFIAARTDVPALLAHVDELEAAWRNERATFASCNRARQHCERECEDLRKRVAELEARTTYTPGETEWANRIAHAEAQLAQLCGLSCLREGNAFRRGAEAMREACAQWTADFCSAGKADALRALPIPEKP